MSQNQDILNSFIEISNKSLDLVSKWRQGSQEIMSKVNVNGQTDVVTELDCQIEMNAKELLNIKFPNFEFVGEEGFKGNFEVFSHDYFIIDPIDGTKPFVEGSKDWGISICCVIGGIPTVALLNIPDKNICITGIVGEGVRINGKPYKISSNVNRKVGVSPRQLSLVEDCFLDSDFVLKKMSALTPKVAVVISGEVGSAFYCPEKGKSASIWDYAAACFLLQEAGGMMRSFQGSSMPYSGDNVIHRGGWIAAKSDIVFQKVKSFIDTKLQYNCI